MHERKPTPAAVPRTVLWVVIGVFAVLYGGYQVGKELALRDNAKQAAGQ
ncbi:hypothetical protein [Stenotrophomonas sp. YAU14D1_LEIMI4_1]|nr:hypothetical protein [Stenotrophomonas sp. YAU14D1_LEIMI4_1]